MKKTITSLLLGVLLVGTLGAAVVSAVASNNTTEKTIANAVASDDAKAKDDLEQMHNLCSNYMNSGTSDEESMHNSCGKFMNSGTSNSNNLDKSVGQTNTGSGNNKGGISCH